MSSIRNKHGSLQMYKGKKWKTYSFKVTGSTYLHYFGESKATEPKDQIFLTTVSAVEVPPKAPKNGNFVFEVRHSGKSSPWILSADSEEERRDWMETIKPNSTTMLHNSQIKDIHQRNKTILNRGGPPSPQPGHQYGNGSATMGANRSPSVYQRSSLQYSATVRNPHTGATQGRNYSEPAVQPYPYTNPQFLSLGGTGGAFVGGGDSYQLTQSLPSSPSLSPPSPIPLTPPGVQPRPPETQPHPHKTEPQPHEVEPQPLQRPMSMSDRPPMPEPRQLIMAGPPAEYLDPLQLNMPAGSKRIIEDNDGGTCPVTPSGDEPTPTGNQYLLIAPPSKTRPDHKETCLLKDRSKPNTPQSPPVCVTPPTSPATIDPIFETLKSQFTASQIQALVEMLAKMNDKGGGGGGEANVGYLVTKTANTLNESMLVTEDDDPDHYNERPKWAKAINEQVTDNSEPLLPDASTVNIPRTSLTNMNRIGAGHFGDVFSADYTPEGFGPEDSIKVAVKTAKKGVTEGKRKEILREVSVMTNMVHPNLVRLYGTNEEDGLPWLVLEYLPHGDLKHYLQNSPTKKSPDSLVKYMVDVAMGMHYIAERGLVHRDLAARNVLVGNGEICKVADFGLLRELPEDDSIYVSSSNIPCPIRWMPPEAISKRSFSVASDVWSFGILQWEMMNPGKLPYANFGNYEVVSKISEGYRMPTPRGCPPVVARIMKSCWHADPKKRPSFLLITTLLTTKFTTQQATSNRQNGASPKLNDINVYM